MLKELPKISVEKLRALAPEELAEVEALLDEAERQECERSFAFFLKQAWKYIDPAPYVHNWHIDVIAEHAEAVIRGDIRRLIVNQPPRTMKSILLSVAYVAWVWAQRDIDSLSGPQVKFMYASYGQGLSLDHSVLCRNLIQSNWYQKLWGHRFKLVGDQNTKGMFVNDKGGYRIATSVGSGLTGRGADIIIVDDPHNTQDVVSEAERVSTINWWSQSLSTRLNDPKTGAYIVVMQRQHEEDLTGYVLGRGQEWVHLMLPMRYDPGRRCETILGFEDPREEEGELLWPDRMGEEEVKHLEAELGSYGTSGQLQQSPTPRGGGIIKEEWWKLWGNPQDPDDKRYKSFPPMEYIIGSLDTAYTEKQENDFSALTIWGVYRDDHDLPKIMLMSAWQIRLELNPLVEKVIKSCKRFKIDKLLVEGKASGLSVAQEIRRLTGGEMWATQIINPKGQDKVSRAYSVQHLWEQGVIFAPDREWADMVIREVGAFPKAKHDDIMDTCTQAVRFLRDTGWALRRDERERDIESRLQPHGEQVALYDV